MATKSHRFHDGTNHSRDRIVGEVVKLVNGDSTMELRIVEISGFRSSKISSKKLRQPRARADRRLPPPLSHLNRMKRGPIPDDDDDDTVARKGKVVTTTEGWPELLRCTTTKPPPILLDELIAEILLRIPASVCSSWRTLISSSQFAKDHLRRSMAMDPALTHPRIAYHSTWHSYPTIGVFSVRSVFENRPHEPTKVVGYEGRRHLRMIGSCNGLLCLHYEQREDGVLGPRAILWNPCTGFTSQPLEIGGIFDVCGFGYDHVNDKYKLFVIVEKKSGESFTRIFTFGPKSTWRTIQDFPYRLHDPNNKTILLAPVGLFVSGTGTLNWLLCSSRTSFVAVLSLDLVKETYSQISLPSRDSDDSLRVFPQLATLRGCLAVCYETKKTHWTLWMMKEYGVPQSWTKLAIIPHHPLLVDPPRNFSLEPVYMLKNDVLLVISPSCKFVLCNLNDGSIDFPNIDSSGDGMTQLRPLSRGVGGRTYHIYHESLVSPSHFGLPTCSSEMRSGFRSSKISSKKLRQPRARADRRLPPPLSHLNRMKRGPIPDDDDTVARKGKVVTTTEGWPELLRCTTTKPPPILLDELIAEILLRIPARSLVRLRNSVCSSWRTLISSSQFAKDHLRRSMAVDPALTHPRIAYYSFWHSYPTIGVFSVRSVFENHPHEPTKVVAYEGRRHLRMIGSCNGLLCLHDKQRKDGLLGPRAMLWNPCTGFTSQPLEIGGIFRVCGFGYDHVNDKYKLFVIVENKSGESFTRIFTFGPKSTWRTIQDFPYRLHDPNNKAILLAPVGLFVSGTGTLNWLLCSSRTSFVAVLSLDLVKETYSQISLPSRDSDDALRVFPHLSILRGCLAVCYETKKTHWTLWMMKEYGVPQSWTKLAIIPHHPLLVDAPRNFSLEPVYMLKNDVLLVISPSCKFVLCNLNDGNIDFPNIDSSGDGMTQLRPLSRGAGGRSFHIYHESLVSPSHFGLPTCSSQMRLFKPSL
ncbi:hypothetical protein Ahy_B10g106011 isoform B [Arachis hypogaea]|uniref:F-box domain-containing protein n=1 Tax=Arachis hypogaea TaxID=3818 RepID=A0A444X9H0_ARAHY|nr:hypothetical protein Ahy_B10g106011 isoform B [Arachis hypogaea]